MLTVGLLSHGQVPVLHLSLLTSALHTEQLRVESPLVPWRWPDQILSLKLSFQWSWLVSWVFMASSLLWFSEWRSSHRAKEITHRLTVLIHLQLEFAVDYAKSQQATQSELLEMEVYAIARRTRTSLWAFYSYWFSPRSLAYTEWLSPSLLVCLHHEWRVTLRLASIKRMIGF